MKCGVILEVSTSSHVRGCLTAVISKIVPLKDVHGRVYKFKSNSKCLDLGVPTLVLPDKVRRDKVLVLGGVPRKLDYVKVMIVSV